MTKTFVGLVLTRFKNWVVSNVVSLFYMLLGLFFVLLFFYLFGGGFGGSAGSSSFSNIVKSGLSCFVKMLFLGFLLNCGFVKGILGKIGMSPLGLALGVILGSVITALLFHGFTLGISSLVIGVLNWFFPSYNKSVKLMSDSDLTCVENFLAMDTSYHEKMKAIRISLEQQIAAKYASPLSQPSPESIAPSLFEAESSPIKSSSTLVTSLGVVMMGVLAREGLKLLYS